MLKYRYIIFGNQRWVVISGAGKSKPAGTCTLEAIYKEIQVLSCGPNLPWNKIWRFPVLRKLKFFLWRGIHNRLPTKALLSLLMDEMSPLCSLCHASETINHLLCNCPFSIRVWILWSLFPRSLDNSTNHPTFLKWFIVTKSAHKLKLGTIVSWFIWKSRNNLIFSYQPPHPGKVRSKSITHILEWNLTRVHKSRISCCFHDR